MPRPLADRRWVGWATFAARQILGIVLVVAGALKLPWPEASVQAVRAYQLLPFDLTRPIGYALPVLEVIVGLLLMLGLFTRLAAWIGAAVMVAFIVGISWVWAHGISIDCGCFGGGGASENGIAQYPWEIARDVGLLACGVWGGLFPRSPLALDTWLFGAAESIDTDVTEDEDPEES
ncbi:MauE/DoxX family redox-associated membrane protein [Micropruina sonneratiae]|uniref:MauE/DoxX family redox-associated membrane protein n=1 Tax=Micropruina sonneratiae TaxID=2986940 RepID=UPI002226CA7F|nr:DoxX family protein [Micropruina sp. KQZ13P-5]MCW3158321.1 DoxX family protein [Micropruina sp. KQZ13P-5]